MTSRTSTARSSQLELRPQAWWSAGEAVRHAVGISRLQFELGVLFAVTFVGG
jgi:hypothetical protein